MGYKRGEGLRSGMGVRPEDVTSVERNLPKPPEFHRPANSAHFAFQFPCSKEVAQVLKFFRKNLTGNSRSG